MFCLMLFRSFTALCACDMVHFAALVQWARPGLTPRFSHINNKKRQQQKKTKHHQQRQLHFIRDFNYKKRHQFELENCRWDRAFARMPFSGL